MKGEAAKIDKAVVERIEKMLLGKQLTLAIQDNYSDKVKELLSKDPTLVDYQDQEGNTPLHIAAFSSRNKIAQFLIDNKANSTIKNKYGFTPGHIPLGNELIEAIGSDDIKKVTKLLKQYPELINFKDESNSTPLHAASIKLNYNMVKFLLDEGADINAQGQNGKSPLHESALFRVGVEDTTIIEDTLTRVQIQKIEQDYRVKLKQARASGIKTIKLLIDRDANVNAVTSQGDTALHIAAQSAYPTEKIAEMLIKVGIDVDKQNDSKETALDIAIKEKKEDLVNAIKSVKRSPEKHADLNLKDKPNFFANLLSSIEYNIKGLSKALAVPKISSWGQRLFAKFRFSSPKTTNQTSSEQNNVLTTTSHADTKAVQVTSPPHTPDPTPTTGIEMKNFSANHTNPI